MNQEFPRRIRIDLMTPEEKALFDMVGKIEELGAHPLLTDCVVLLGEARSKLSDWVDLQAAEHVNAADGAKAEPVCNFFGCTNPVCDADKESPDRMHFCQQHHDQLHGYVERNETQKILGFWVKANGGAKRLASTF